MSNKKNILNFIILILRISKKYQWYVLFIVGFKLGSFLNIPRNVFLSIKTLKYRICRRDKILDNMQLH